MKYVEMTHEIFIHEYIDGYERIDVREKDPKNYSFSNNLEQNLLFDLLDYEGHEGFNMESIKYAAKAILSGGVTEITFSYIDRCTFGNFDENKFTLVVKDLNDLKKEIEDEYNSKVIVFEGLKKLYEDFVSKQNTY